MITETDREVGHKRIAAGDARTATIRRRYDAPVDDVWSACTEPDRLRRWFLPLSRPEGSPPLRSTGDLRSGGTFSLERNASGEIVRCEPPELLVLTWRYGDRPVDEVELRLSANAGGTLLEIEHATVSEEIEWEGQMYDVIPGVGTGWEVPLTLTLPAYLRGELSGPPSDEELAELDRLAGAAWTAVMEAAR